MDVPAEPAREALVDQLAGLRALLGQHAALAGVLDDARKLRGARERDLGRLRQGAVAHRRDQHRHRQLERLCAVPIADRRLQVDRRERVGRGAYALRIDPERDVVEMRHGLRRPVTADAIAADLALGVDVAGDAGVPVAPGFGDRVGQRPRDRLVDAVAQLGAGVDDLLERSLERDAVFPQEGANVRVLLGRHRGELRVRAEALHPAADVDRAAAHVLADALAGIAEDDDAPAVHHVAGEEAGVPAAEQRPRLHHLAGARADVPFHDDLAAAQGDASDGARVAADHHRAVVKAVADAPADIGIDLEARAVGEARAEIAGRTPDPDRDRGDQPHAEVMARVRVDEFDVLAAGGGRAHRLVGVADRDGGEI